MSRLVNYQPFAERRELWQETATGSALLPQTDVGGGGTAGLGDGDPVRDPGRNPRIIVDPAAGSLDHEHPAAARLTVLPPVHEVAQPVGNQRRPDVAGTEDPVGMAA